MPLFLLAAAGEWKSCSYADPFFLTLFILSLGPKLQQPQQKQQFVAPFVQADSFYVGDVHAPSNEIPPILGRKHTGAKFCTHHEKAPAITFDSAGRLDLRIPTQRSDGKLSRSLFSIRREWWHTKARTPPLYHSKVTCCGSTQTYYITNAQ